MCSKAVRSPHLSTTSWSRRMDLALVGTNSTNTSPSPSHQKGGLGENPEGSAYLVTCAHQTYINKITHLLSLPLSSFLTTTTSQPGPLWSPRDVVPAGGGGQYSILILSFFPSFHFFFYIYIYPLSFFFLFFLSFFFFYIYLHHPHHPGIPKQDELGQ